MGRTSLGKRRGVFRPRLLGPLVLALSLPFLAGSLLPSFGPSAGGVNPITCRVTREAFVNEISARGDVQSAVNVEVRCEVRAGQHSWVRILEVIPEGTHVEPGDLLIRLDSTALETEREQQKIYCEQAKAAAAAARAKYEIARHAKQVYLEAEHKLQKEELEVARLAASQRAQKAEQQLAASRKLEARGYVTAQQLRADEFALAAAETELKLAQLKLDMLDKYTKPKRLKEAESALATTGVRLEAAEFYEKVSREKLADLEAQIGKCVVRAPVAGDVVLAHLHHNDHSHMIAPGESSFQNRVLVRLPDFRHMQVKAKIEEDKIAVVRPGLPVAITLEAFPEVELSGEVVRVNAYPEPDLWHASGIKTYESTVRIDSSLEGLRPGLTADLRIRVERLEDQLQVPCQAVFRHGDKAYCIAEDEGGWEAREVTLGSTNGKAVVISSGLEEGQSVVLNAASYRGQVALPELAEESPPQVSPAHAPAEHTVAME